jgi:hypothetical protein
MPPRPHRQHRLLARTGSQRGNSETQARRKDAKTQRSFFWRVLARGLTDSTACWPEPARNAAKSRFRGTQPRRKDAKTRRSFSEMPPRPHRQHRLLARTGSQRGKMQLSRHALIARVSLWHLELPRGTHADAAFWCCADRVARDGSCPPAVLSVWPNNGPRYQAAGSGSTGAPRTQNEPRTKNAEPRTKNPEPRTTSACALLRNVRDGQDDVG